MHCYATTMAHAPQPVTEACLMTPIALSLTVLYSDPMKRLQVLKCFEQRTGVVLVPLCAGTVVCALYSKQTGPSRMAPVTGYWKAPTDERRYPAKPLLLMIFIAGVVKI